MSRRHGSTLAALPSTPPPALPDVDDIVSAETLRPGEFHEPVVIAQSTGQVLVATARACGLGSSQAASLLAEGRLLYRDCVHLGLKQEDVAVRLNRAATHSRVVQPLADREAAYLRALTAGGRAPTLPTGDLHVSISRRLLRRLSHDDLTSAVGPPLEPLVRWEIAAVCEGRTLTEWALMTLLKR